MNVQMLYVYIACKQVIMMHQNMHSSFYSYDIVLRLTLQLS